MDDATKGFIMQQVCSSTVLALLILYSAICCWSLGHSAETQIVCATHSDVQTMYRIKDPKRSIEFYTGVLGMRWAMLNQVLAHGLDVRPELTNRKTAGS